jgi:glutamate N-acetyltransferase/amino-acid N-acetyltransferase
MRDAVEMAAHVARLLLVPEGDVLVASTGIIGHPLPMDKIAAGIEEAVRSLSADGGINAARAIMTTDTRPKEASVEIEIGGKMVRIGGMAKGAGMICPNVATMLAFITTDAAISPEMLQDCLARSAEVSFNCLTVDGDTSTNDTVIMLANGMAGNPVMTSQGPELSEFKKGLDLVTTDLAKQIAADGEGATKLVEIVVQGAKTYEDCRQIAKTIANSPLVKTAMFGCDPNWGRILAAAGRAGVDFDPKAVELRLGDIPLIRGGEPVEFSEREAHDYLTGKDILVDLTVGPEKWGATVWTCDFSYDYVKINAEYHT